MRRFKWVHIVAGGVLVGVTAFAYVRPDVSAASAIPAPAAVTVDTLGGTSSTTTTAMSQTTVSTFTASTTTVTEAPLGDLVIQAVGDVNFDPDYISTFAESGYDVAFEGLDGVFLDDDLTVINLECPPTDAGQQADKDYSFHCDPAALPVAAANGVDVANLANNHGQDRGVEGLLDSIDNVASAGIAPVGVGSNVDEATAPAIIEVDGWTVAVLGMGGVVPGDGWLATEDSPGMASGDDLDQMVSSVKAADELADVVVVTIHWGRELVTDPDVLDRARAEAMIEAGADVVFGHHPHRLGSMEMIGNAPVFWTLGNFIWPRLSDAGATTAIARVTFRADGGVETCMTPVFIETSGRPEVRGNCEPSK